MGSGEKHHMINFNLYISHLLHHHHNHHHHHHHRNKDEIKGVPKGCMVVLVGHEGEEKLERFVIPIVYTNHPKFLDLLKEAEEEYGFNQKGPITIPCHVEQFRHVQGLIDREYHMMNYPHHHHHHHDQHHHHHNFLCFKA
ncbi:auxin-responsive protein SAUR32 [Beta vulgaris subsp. vulgaris]|uniref:auxin-responsive protein SAUR32 n=1 Tax=Beta vulgaris subsp. vulgaris TaxID=3555 RepID=UPI002549087A|nr:auxin-responsive protein SAUR32 [Beta vulgaris subsp. vulgaris]